MKVLRKRSFWVCLAVVFLPLLLSGIWYTQQVRQQRLDRDLIEAIKEQATPTAIALLNAGADANAVDKPYVPISLQYLSANIWNVVKGNNLPKKTEYQPSALLLRYWLPHHSHYIFPEQESDSPELVRALLKHGANPYATDEDGLTVLHYACCHGDTNTVKFSLEQHINPNVKNAAGATPLMYYSDTYECDQLLIQYGAEVNVADANRITPLLYASDHYSTKIVQLLLDHKAHINAQDHEGYTPLIRSLIKPIIGPNEDVARLLLQNGAHVSIQDHGGFTALDYARDNQEKDLIPLLVAALKKEQAQQKSSATK